MTAEITLQNALDQLESAKSRIYEANGVLTLMLEDGGVLIPAANAAQHLLDEAEQSIDKFSKFLDTQFHPEKPGSNRS